MVDESDGITAEIRAWCEQHRSFEMATMGVDDSVLLRLAAPAHADDIADEVYTLVAANVPAPDGVRLTHAVVDERTALELVVLDASLDVEAVRSLVDDIGAESERLIGLWHPAMPESGA